MVEAASHVTREGAREDLQDFFAAVDGVIAIEHQTDSASAVNEQLLAGEGEGDAHRREPVAAKLEQAADALSMCGLKLRDHVLGDALAAWAHHAPTTG